MSVLFDYRWLLVCTLDGEEGARATVAPRHDFWPRSR